jgi:hypothetical protein
MTEFNAQEIIDFIEERTLKDLNWNFGKDIPEEELERWDKEAMRKCTDDVRKVERYAVLLKEKGKCCELCWMKGKAEYSYKCPECKEPVRYFPGEVENYKFLYRYFKPQLTIEDFR